MPNKRKETYTRLFAQLKAWLEPVATLQFLVDFEQGAYLTLVEVEGCFFHLCQRLDYHVKELGLMTKYQNDPDFKLRVKKLAALAFLPLADVIDAFEVLADTFEDDELLLLGYFEPTWIGVTVGRGAQIRAADCTYLPSCHVERPRASLHGYDSDHQRSRGIPSRL